jgi:Ala-tRNA(Pro) deacylase
MADKDVTVVLDEAGIEYEVLPHPRTETAAAEAEALGIGPRDVAKTLVISTPSGYVRAVVQASDRIDLRKLRDRLEGGKRIHLASEEDLERDYPGFELGAVPPFGGSSDQVLVDVRLAERESIVLEAGSHEQSVRMRTRDLLELTGAEVADIAHD